MHYSKILAFALLSGLSSAQAATLLFSDNFNTGTTSSLDSSPLTPGRVGGTLAAAINLRSALAQQSVTNNQLSTIKPGGTNGRVRFQDAVVTSNWFNFAAGATGSLILADGGLRVEFDYTSPNLSSTNWIAFDVGFANGAEPGGRLNNSETDLGILFRENGALNEYFDNGIMGSNGTFPAALTHHVTLEYSFSSFADGSVVTLNSYVDSVPTLSNYNFTWANNGGALYMEIESAETGIIVDNVSVSTIPEASTFSAMALLGGALLRRRSRRFV